MFHNNIMKMLEKLNKTEHVENLPPSYLPYAFLHNLHFYYGKKVIRFNFLKNK